ncbi:cupin 2 domain-containing protein [Candidatus Moduliflexus flocculans]|uniref:Cupin 2 domain-containing protein n=1 Tax=Candidatus Moduliflexus flocculans TaxID=1499966 RepID=A0A081BT01_9BACT|nr:cupin 2 domain-containing protein [Candidatus Moduliflexus flocculans]
MIVKHDHITGKDLGGGVVRKVLASGGKMMAVEFTFANGSIGAIHSHPHEQIGYVAKGRFEATVGEQKAMIQEGDTYYVAPNVMHGVVALEDGVLIDVFTPQREDFLN